VASDKGIVDFIVEQIAKTGQIVAKKMFGEYTIYCDGKIIALVCDNQLFVKPTSGGRLYIGNVVEAPPYHGAKNYFLIDDKIEDQEWLCGLAAITYKELPMPKPKR
jgi:TfoX/Sxy family transcriptional regulator of competence genes